MGLTLSMSMYLVCSKSECSIISKPLCSIDRSTRIRSANVNPYSGLSLVLDLVRVVILLGLRVGVIAATRSRGLHLAFSTFLCAANLGGSPLGDTCGLLRGGGAVLPAHLDGKQTEALPGGLGGDSKLRGNSVKLFARKAE